MEHEVGEPQAWRAGGGQGMPSKGRRNTVAPPPHMHTRECNPQPEPLCARPDGGSKRKHPPRAKRGARGPGVTCKLPYTRKVEGKKKKKEKERKEC